MAKEDFLGKGWSFPPTFNISTNTVEMVSDEQDIQQSLAILLSTNLGERILRSDYGCGIDAMPFEAITVTFLTKVKKLIEKAILLHEPRINLDDIFFTNPDKTIEGVINIEIYYTIRATNSRLNYVYPFYIKEGTYLNTK